MAVRVKDKGYNKLMKSLETLRASHVRVGIFGSAGEKSSGDGVTVGDIAVWSELGIGQPQRSWLGEYVDKNRTKIERSLKTIAEKAAKGEVSLKIGLELLGQKSVGEIQERIASSIPPPNAPSTIAKKGSSTTLIDTGLFRSSITYEVVEGGPK